MNVPENSGYLDQAKELHQADNLEEAEVAYKKAIMKKPENAEALALLGVLCCQSGRLEEGIQYLRKATTYNPKSAETYYNLAKALSNVGLLEDAVTAYKASLRIRDDYVDAWNNLGDCFSQLGRVAESVQAYEKALKLDPNQFVYFNLGNALLETEDLDSAVECYKQAFDIDPGFSEATLNLTTALKRQGYLADAKAWCELTLEIRPDYVKALNELASLFHQMRETEKATQTYKRALELEPNNPIANHWLNSLAGKSAPKADPAYVEELFDQYALRFDDHLTQQLQYKVPSVLFDMVKENESEKFRFSSVLDIGCGTGLCGSLFRPHCEKLYGVDISSKMIQEARKKKVYDDLSDQEIFAYLGITVINFDLILSADVFVYFGYLEPVFQGITKVSKEDTCFAFSTETYSGREFGLKPSGRFGHSREYVEVTANKFGWNLDSVQSDTIRVENGQPVPGDLYLFRLK